MSTHVNGIADKFAPCYPADHGDLAKIAAHYTVQAYAAQHLAYFGPLWKSLEPAGYPDSDRLEWWRTATLNAANAFAAATALNALLWGDAAITHDYADDPTGCPVADTIHAAHDGEGEQCADLLNDWLTRHGIDLDELTKACEATR